MYSSRVNRLKAGLFIVAGILLIRLFVIQIIDDKYKINASNNSMVYDIVYPTRGIIYDRNGKIIVGNKVAYDILVTPKEVQPFDTLLLSDVLGVSSDFIRDKMKTYRRGPQADRLPVNCHAQADSVHHLYEIRGSPV